MKSMENTTHYTLSEITKVVDTLFGLMKEHSVITLTGSLGAGKTTLTQALLKKCGVTDPVTSPTFTYVNRYENSKGEVFYHFDLYRIKTIDEFIMAGFDEYLYQPKTWCIIEWPEVILPLLKHSVCHVCLEYQDEKSRKALITCKV